MCLISIVIRYHDHTTFHWLATLQEPSKREPYYQAGEPYNVDADTIICLRPQEVLTNIMDTEPKHFKGQIVHCEHAKLTSSSPVEQEWSTSVSSTRVNGFDGLLGQLTCPMQWDDARRLYRASGL